MKRFFVFCIILFSAAALLISLPATDARFLNIEITYHLQSDGSWDMEYSHQVRLDTYFAVNRALGETFIVYNPDFQKLEIMRSETTMADGRKVAAPANAFNEVLPFPAHGFADFSGLREMVITHTGLERGAMVDLHYRIHTQAGFLPVFSGREALAKAFPIDTYKLNIIVPANQVLHYRIFGLKAEPEISSVDQEKHFVFTLAHVKPFIAEPLSSELAASGIVFSTAADWQQALALTGDLSQMPDILAKQIEKLQAQTPAVPDLLAALQRIAAIEYQNCALETGAAGWQPRPIDHVAISNYGTGLEKALLMQTMLKKAGFASELLAVAASADFAPDVCTSLQIGEYWLKVADKDGVAYLDPCHEQYEFFPYRCQGFGAYNLERMEMEKLPVSDWNQNGVDISGALQLDTAGVSGTLVVAVRGIFNRYNEVMDDSGKFIAAVLRKFFPVEKVEIKKLLALSRREVRAEATFSGKWLKEAGAGFHSIDACRLPGLNENMVQLLKRELPLALDAPFKVSLELELQPANGLSLDYTAPEVDLTNDIGFFARKHSLQKNGHIRFSQSCGVLKTPVSVEAYPRLRELFQAYFTPDFWLVFKKSN